MQLISALRTAHGSGLLLRPASLLPSKVLLTSPGRIRVGELYSLVINSFPKKHGVYVEVASVIFFCLAGR